MPPEMVASAGSDEALIEEFRQGRREAFEQLVRRHQRPVVNFFYRSTWDAHLAEDLAQEVFVRLFRHLGKWDPRAKFTTYLYRVARNLWIDRLRSKADGPPAVSLDRPLTCAGEGEGRDVVPAPAQDPGEAVEGAEESVRLRRALGELPEELRSVVVLAEFQGLRYDEVSEVLEIPVGTVKSRMHAAIDRLRRTLVKEPHP